MIFRLRLRVLLGAFLLGLLVGLWSPPVAHAQVVDPGLQTVGEVTNLTATDPRVIATRIINIALGTLGIILLCVILYAGFLWMTAGGDPKQVQKAKDMIRNGIIGVVIILCSWMIVTFVINKLLGAVGGDGSGRPVGGGGGQGGVLDSGGGALGFQVRALSPTGAVPLRNVEARFFFSRDLRASTVTSSIKVLRADSQVPVDGTLEVNGAVVTFTPDASCPPPNAGRHCFQGNTEFILRVERSLRSGIGQSIACGGLAPACEARFTTGNLVDVSPPRVDIFAPLNGQGIPANDLVRVQTHASDDSGISVIESYADGRSLGTAVRSGTSTEPFLDGVVVWDTHGVATGTHQIISHARDLDANQATSSAVTVVVRPRHCFNELQDEGETGLNCGGDCGRCARVDCREDTDCGGGVCGVDRVCVEQPIITGLTPNNGAIGTFVTVQGVNFGTTTGQVLFGGLLARAPDACVAAGGSLWSQTQVVVQVPIGATTSTVQLINHNGLLDTTTDERGPRVGEFVVNNRIYPGLCAVRPGSAPLGSGVRLDMTGVNLGSTSDRIRFNDREFNRFLAWSDRNIALTSPLIDPGSYAVQAQVSGVNSNPVFFSLEERVLSDAPVIESIEPATGTVGSYITITGRNFGSSGQVYFRTGGMRAVGDTVFPAECRNNYWRNHSVIVKIPATINDGLGASQAIAPGTFAVTIERASGPSESAPQAFQIVSGSPVPGICGIQPIAGPGGTPITVIGEHLGSSAAHLVFPSASATVDATISASTDQSIRATVPATAVSGLVHVTVAGQSSNGVAFSARNCNEEAGICENGQACCADGSCAVDGVCRDVARSAQFAWRSSTGRIIMNPQVVEACNAQDPPSPSPLSTRAGGNNVCVNAQVVALFNMHLDRRTVTNPGTVIVTRCTGTTGDPCASGTPETVTGGTLELHTHDHGDYLVFTPPGTGLWRANSTYQVIFKKQIQATVADGGLTMLENRDRFGEGNGYAFRFQTRESDTLCQATSVSVSPFNWMMSRLGDTKEYTLSPRGEDICVQLNGHTMDWNWSISDPSKAIFSPAADLHDIQTAQGIGPTESPIQVRASLARPVPPVPVIGSGDLSIRLEPPRVTAHGPDCDQACINAATWARFSVSMDATSLTHLQGGVRIPNIIIRPCVNQSCRAFGPALAITSDMLRLEDTAGEGGTTENMLIVDSGRTTLLERDRFYKVWVLGGDQGLRSAYGHLPLTGLNDGNPAAFSWTFHVRGGTNPVCAVDHVDVVPGEKYENAIGARQLFSARPVSAADSCSQTGQILITSSDFGWRTSDAEVSDFAAVSGGSGSLSLARSLPPFCTNQCLNAGSAGVYGHLAVCGNHRVETVSPQLCHPRSAPNRNCLVTDRDCETATHADCVLLPPGSSGSEECDQADAYCTSQCLWAGQASRATGGTCGNSVIDRGEECDAGSVCIGGTNPSRDCSIDASVCGTGGSCVAANRQGCSNTCLALGSAAGGSTCGNGDVADGETCDDGNLRNGDGCSSECRAEGSTSGITSFCGDGVIDAGESCDVSIAGNLDSEYCHLVAGVRRCETGTVFRNLCNTTTCLNLGTNRGTTPGLCGNGLTEPGEDCDSEQGCTTRCLFAGSSISYTSPSICGDRVQGTGEQCEAPSTAPVSAAYRQLFEITGLREPHADERDENQSRMKATISADYDSRTGRAIHGVSCNFTSELQCAAGNGLTSGGCCAPRPQIDPQYPTGNDVCRNTVIYAHFNQPMDHGSVERNFIVAKAVNANECPAGTVLLDTAQPVASGFRGWIASIWHRLLAFFSIESALAETPTIWCVGSTQGRVFFQEGADGSTTASFLLSQALQPNTEYQVVLRGETDLTRTPTSTRGIRSARGVVADGNLHWNFRTGADVCLVSAVDIADNVVSHPYLFYRAAEAHRYTARAVSLRHGVEAPIAPIDGLYSWTWQRWTNANEAIVRVIESASNPLQTTATTTAQNKSGSSLVMGSLRISADTVSTSTTLGRVFGASRLSTVILCENPWIPGTAENVSQLPRFLDPEYNFVTAYCRDAGSATSTADDLPNLVIHRLPGSPADTSRGILRQYLFSFDDPALRSDGLGIRIIANRLHMSPADWYLSQGFNGSPEVTTVDGYEALRDGATIYVGAANTDEDMTRADTNIYILSRNPNAGPIATSIYDQMVSNLTFNSNLKLQEQRVCVGIADGEQYISLNGNGLVRCTADWECLRYANNLKCASVKEKIQRDLVRISDFQAMTSQLSSVRTRTGSFPTLATGTELPGFVTSRWAGWQTAFGTALGSAALPQDPINQYLSCGRCAQTGTPCSQDNECIGTGNTCEAIEGRDPATCWSTTNSTYACPVLSATNLASVSHVYQYRALSNGTRYELGTELEAIPASSYRPALLTEVKRCTNNRGLCQVDADCAVVDADGHLTTPAAGTCRGLDGRWVYDQVCRGQAFGNGQVCGDGVIDTRVTSVEVCEVGQRRTSGCDLAGGVRGTIMQTCQADCRGFTNAPGASCTAETLCGNGRVDVKRCTGSASGEPAAGPRYGVSCQTDSDCDTGVLCQNVPIPEICDDGVLNGTYGRCNRTCNGYGGTCGDGEISPGEMCDLGENNGRYCNTAGSCNLGTTCGADCQSRAPFCGDRMVQAPEECDGSSAETSVAAIEGQAACTNVRVGLCAGGPHANEVCTCNTGDSCTTDTAHCGEGNTCVMYRTQHVRTCINPGVTPIPDQCTWTAWTGCQPTGQCGDGIMDPGEQCDDGNRSDNDACTNACKNNVCGDGVPYTGVEECDYGPITGNPPHGNGAACMGADYGSTCVACTAQCRMTASSGGYCGNGHREGAEQCDGTDLGTNATTLSCQSLGYDYAETRNCAPVVTNTTDDQGTVLNAGADVCCYTSPFGTAPGRYDRSRTCQPEGRGVNDAGCHVNTTVPTSCATNQLRDAISCGRTCSFAGCRRCSDTPGTEVITAQVFDAQYSSVPVRSARVTLYLRGAVAGQQFTDESGRFTFNTLSNRLECGQYRLVVDLAGDNRATTDVNEALNGGYWPFESRMFTATTFPEEGIRNTAGKIYLIPRVGRGETMVVHTWNGDLQGRYLLSHLVMPQSRAWNGFTVADPVLATCDAPDGSCQRDIHEQDRAGGFQGNINLASVPYAKLFCAGVRNAADSSGSCWEMNFGPQATRYKLQVPGQSAPGIFNYYISDQLSRVDSMGNGEDVPSAAYYRQTLSTVTIVTTDRIYTVNAPEGTPSGCDGKYWHVFSQDAVTGVITLYTDVNGTTSTADDAYRCGGDLITGEVPTGPASRLPDSHWPVPSTPQTTSWLHFGGRSSYAGIDWDVRR